MKLTELDAQLLNVGDDPRCFNYVDTLEKANGISFLCPKCYLENKGPIGTHTVICWFTGVREEISPGPGRWKPSGTGLGDLTFVAPGSTSVLLLAGCKWHGFVRNGDASPGC